MAVLTEQKQLNLYNFDKPEAHQSRYVLTSPRSLEACSRLKVKPLNLLPKSIKHFEKEHSGKSNELVQLLYEQWDRKRLKNLEKCRRARESMIKEEYVTVRKSQQQKAQQQAYKSQNSPDKLGKRLSLQPMKQTNKSGQQIPKTAAQQSTTKAGKKKLEPPSTTKSWSQNESPQRRNVVFATPRKSAVAKLKTPQTQPKFNNKIPPVSTPQMQTDKKLVELLRCRLERSEKEEEVKCLEWRKWDANRKREEDQKRQQAVKLGRNVAMSRQRWERRMKDIEDRKIREKKEEEEEKIEQLGEADLHHTKLVDHQRRLKFSEVEQRRRENERKKYRQLKSLDSVNKEITEFQKSTEMELNRKMEKAERMRMENEYKELQNIKSMNKKERERFEHISKQLEKQRQLEEEKKLREIQEKLTKAEEIRHNTLTSKGGDGDSGGLMIDKNRKIEEIRKKHERINRENEEKYLQVIDQKDEQMRKAEEIARTNVIHRSYRAQEMRSLCERNWKKNYKKLSQHHENIKKKTQEEIEMKENRLQQHLELKEARVQFTRRHAHEHELQRESLKRKYTNFHKMAQQASLANRVGRGPRTGLVNRSKIDLMC